MSIMHATGSHIINRAIQRRVQAVTLLFGQVILAIDRRKEQLRHFKTLAIIELHELLEEGLVDCHP